MVHVLFEELAPGLNLIVLNILTRFSLSSFTQYVGFIQPNTRFLQLLKVSDVMQTLKHIILKLPHLPILLHPILHQFLQLAFEAILA